MLSDFLDMKKLKSVIEKRICHYEQQGLCWEESASQVIKEVEENPDWGISAMGKAYTHIANLQFEHQVLGGRKRYERGPHFPKIDRNGYNKRKKRTSKGLVIYYDPHPRKGSFRSVVSNPYKPIVTNSCKPVVSNSYKKYTKPIVDTLVALRKTGMSTINLAKLSILLCKNKMSRSTVSRILISASSNLLKEFNTKPIKDPHTIKKVRIDAYYKSVRGFGKIAIYVLMAVRENKSETIISAMPNLQESTETWSEVFQNAFDRGLRMGPETCFIADGHRGIRPALHQVFPETDFQGCQFHKLVNLHKAFRKTKNKPKGLQWETIKSRICQDIFHVLDKKEALEGLARLSDDYQSVLPKVIELLWASFDDMMIYLDYGLEDAGQNRTTGRLERNNREIRRRTNKVNCYPNLDSFLREIYLFYQDFNEEQEEKSRDKKIISSGLFNKIIPIT